MSLQGKTIVLGVSGGIAVYKAVELLRLLTKAGACVHVVMTRSAQEFVTPLTFQTLSGNPVHTSLFNLYQEQEIGHISLADRADCLVIAPATANLIGKLAGGIADDLLTTTVMATKAPVLLAPAMNVNMYENPVYQRNETFLKGLGYRVVEPAAGMLACGWEGKGRLAPPETIFESVCALLRSRQDLAGRTVLVTAGPTREEIDPVRFISNHSSGKMGYAVAQAAQRRGARVLLVSGPVALSCPAGVELIPVESAQQMREAVMTRVAECHTVIKAAAVADYRPVSRHEQKLKKQGERLVLELEKNPDILAELGQLPKRPLLVGFAAETTELETHAAAKLAAKNLDMIVANDVSQEGAGFNVATNIARLLFRDGRVEPLPLMSKEALADIILDRVVALLAA